MWVDVGVNVNQHTTVLITKNFPSKAKISTLNTLKL